MLQAIVKDKARSFFLKNGQRVPREDILTDCLFGGLRYLSPKEATTLLRWMLGDVVSQDYQLAEITLWPKEQSREPDARLVLRAERTPPITIIVEAKWGTNRLTAAQLDDQWRIFATPAIGSVRHLLLLEHRKRIEYLAYEGAPSGVKQHRILVTWSDIAARLLHRNHELGSKETNHLASDITAVLQHSGKTVLRLVDQIPDLSPRNITPFL